MKRHVSIASVIVALILSGPAVAGMIYVDDDNTGGPWDGSEANPYQHIQDGITNANPGDTVIVKDGTYTGSGNKNLDFAGKAITLRSENGAAACIIDCEGSSHGFYFHSSETSASVVDGFTIKNGHTNWGGGIRCASFSSPAITNCTISGNTADEDGGGILCDTFSSPAITNCTISGNTADEDGGGIYCGSSSPSIINCTISGNTATLDGGGIYCTGSPSITNCTISGNTTSRWGGGIYCGFGSPSITNCILWSNAAPTGHEISLVAASTLTVRYSDVQGGAGEAYVESGCTLDLDGTNIDADPLFEPEDGHLKPGSPCIDWCPSGAADDMDGEARPVDIPGVGYDDPPDARTYDIGTDEFVDTDGDGLSDWAEVNVHGTDPGDPDSDDDGLTDGDEVNVHGTDPLDPDPDGDGRNDGQEIADGTNPFYPDNAEKTYYVNDATGNDAWDGLAPSWDGAHGPRLTIQAGIDVTLTGWDYIVQVADGTYTGAGNRDLDFGGKAITVRSESGAATCIIDCEDSGRGFYFHSGETSASVVNGFTIKNGSAYDGGGVYCYSGTSPAITNCTISGNTATDDGGGIWCEDSSPTITNCTVSGNVAEQHGGGICCYDDSGPSITNCTISGNTATHGGGGIRCSSSSPSIINCTISGNVGGTQGAGICCESGSSPSITNCTISGNTADFMGGGISCSSSSPSITNCTIGGNTADISGAAIQCLGSSPTITNCTIAGNNAGFGGGAIRCDSSSPAVTNCILWGNSPDQVSVDSGSPTLTYCDIQGGYAGTGNINLNPRLTADRHLRADSPCIDHCPTGPADDRDGEARPVDIPGVGNDGSDTYDIGADEYVDTDADGLTDWDEVNVHGTDPLDADTDDDGLTDGDEVNVHGTDPLDPDPDGDGRNDGQEIADGTNPFHPDNAEKTYYVNDATGSDAYDGLAAAWDGTHGPKLTIQAGIDSTITGWDYVVQVADGTYTGTGNKNLDFGAKTITVKSDNGAAVCIVDCEDSGRGFYFHSSGATASVVDGFTIKNGNADYGGGIYCYESSPTITNCTISGNTVAHHGGGIFCYQFSSPTITNCTISGNMATDCGGGIFCRESSPTITDCTISGNMATYDGGGISCYYSHATMTNCTISGNTAHQDGGGISCFESDPTMTNCTISGNTAHQNGGGISCYAYSDPTMTNCILWGNTAPTGHEIALRHTSFPSTLTVRYSDVQGGVGEAYVQSGCTLDLDGTNIDADPLFVADWHLTVGSPCIDHCPTGPAADMDGEARPVDIPAVGNDGSDTYDIGADEYVDTDADGLSDWAEVNVYGTDAGDADSDDDGLTDGDEVNVHGTDSLDDDSDDDGLTDGDEVNVHGTDPLDDDTDDDGRNDGQEIADGTNPFHPDNAEKTYYVNDATGSDGYDGLAAAWDGTHGPKLTIQAGIDATITGWDYVVQVADGTYTGAGNKELDFGGKAITLRSENGAATCIMDCEDSGRGFTFHSGETTASIVDGLTVTNGNTSDYGAGIYCSDSSPTIINCIISNNTADTKSGGGMFCSNASPVVINCIISDNTVVWHGGGIDCRVNSSPSIINCTITGNTASGSGGGIRCNDSSPTVTNCILWDNSPTELHVDSGSPTLSYCDIQGGYAGTGNINADPLFVDCASADYRLEGGSPCVDAGTSDGTPTQDKEGTARWDDLGVPNTGGGTYPYYEIGAYELADTDSDGLSDWDEVNVYGTDPDDDDSDDDGLNDGDEVNTHSTDPLDDDTDDDGLSDGDEVNVHGTDPLDADSDDDGLTDWDEVNVHGTDPLEPDPDNDGRNDPQEIADGTDPFHPDNAEKTYYVDDVTGSDGYDGLAAAWDGTHGPKLTIQAGIDATLTGWDYVVQVADGTYTGAGNKDLDFGGKAITLRSENGAAACIIDCEGTEADQHQGFYFHSGETSASIVDGFTITKGNTGLGGGIWCRSSSSPTITNCTLTNSTASYGGGICWYSDCSPSITNCTISGNIAGGSGGGMCAGAGASITNCTISGNMAGDCGGGLDCASSSTLSLTNCTISGNVADDGGGIHCGYNSNATMTNCILWGNTAPTGHEIFLVSTAHPSTLTVRYSDVQGGAGEAYVESGCTLDLDGTNIDADPLFIHGALHDYYLSQTAAGQLADSPCVDTGSDTAANLGLDELTTRTDGEPDAGIVDMGYHAPPAILGDVDGNGVVDGLDLTAVLSAWETVPGDPLWNENADLDGNGIINGLDLTEVISNWTTGAAAEPPAASEPTTLGSGDPDKPVPRRGNVRKGRGSVRSK